MKATGKTLTQIRHAIFNGEYASGERLQAGNIAAELETSGTVIREVFAQLAAEGLLRRIPNRGFFIPELDLQELSDLTELRCQVETTAARLAVQRGDVRWESDLTAAHHALTRTPRRAVGDSGPYDETWAAAHKAFHRQLLAGCDSEHFLRVAENLADHTDLYRRWSAKSRRRPDRNPEEEHLGLLEAALARDGDLLAKRLRAHYELTADLLRSDFLSERAEPSKDAVVSSPCSPT